MIVPLLVFIAVGLITYTGFLKLRWLAADGADVCNDDCGGVCDRYSGSGLSQQPPFHAAITQLMKNNQPAALRLGQDRPFWFEWAGGVFEIVRTD